MDERKRDSIVAYLRRRMAEFGIELDDVAAVIAQDQIQQKSAKYRSATGETWSGEGEMPQWLKQAISAGQSVEHFGVAGAAQSAPAAGPRRLTGGKTRLQGADWPPSRLQFRTGAKRAVLRTLCLTTTPLFARELSSVAPHT